MPHRRLLEPRTGVNDVSEFDLSQAFQHLSTTNRVRVRRNSAMEDYNSTTSTSSESSARPPNNTPTASPAARVALHRHRSCMNGSTTIRTPRKTRDLVASVSVDEKHSPSVPWMRDDKHSPRVVCLNQPSRATFIAPVVVQTAVLRSKIDTDQSDAVEVTLDDSSVMLQRLEHTYSSPERRRGVQDLADELLKTPPPNVREVTPVALDYREDRNASILEDELSHATPQTPVVVRFCGLDWCEPTAEQCGASASCDRMSQQQHIQNEICTSLGGWCGTPWQSEYPSASPHTTTTNVSPSKRSPNFLEEGRRARTLKRRPLDLAARRARLSLLRRNLNPFDERDSTVVNPRVLAKSQSFNQVAPSKSTTRHRNVTKSQRQSSLSSVFECGAFDTTTNMSHASPATIRAQWEDQLEGYDSDPQDYTEQENPVRRTRPSSTTVEEFLNERTTLILHTADDTSFAVHAWIERGQRLPYQTLLPRLNWKPVHAHVSHQANLVGAELLDICRVLPYDPATAGHSSQSPLLAQSDRLVCVKTVTGDCMVLEAASRSERDRWMTLLKLTVSEFAVKLLTGESLAAYFSESAVLDEQCHMYDPQQPDNNNVLLNDDNAHHERHQHAWV